MSFQTINGQYSMRPGFNSYRFGCGRPNSLSRDAMSMNGSLYSGGLTRYQAPGNVGTYFQAPTPEPVKTSFFDGFVAFLNGIADNAGSIAAIFTGGDGSGQA